MPNLPTIELHANAGWCWFQDPRVIVGRGDAAEDTPKGTTGEPSGSGGTSGGGGQAVVFGSIASEAGIDGDTRRGDVDVTCYDTVSGRVTRHALAKILCGGQGDDHHAPALWRRPDGRYLVMYTGHNYGGGQHTGSAGPDRAPLSFYRITTRPDDIRDWQPEQTFAWPTRDPVGEGRIAVTYSNLLHLADEGAGRGRLYNFARAAGQTWQFATSDDWGQTWAYRGILTLPPPGGRAYSNGYLKFAGNGKDRIDFIATQAHPRDYNNGVYHGYIQHGKTHDAAGNVIDPETASLDAPPPEAFTRVWTPEEVGEQTYHHGWTTELTRDSRGNLHALFTTRFGTESSPIQTIRPGIGDNDHRLFYARLDGARWRTTELCPMGPGLYDSEEDYTGLGAIDPRDGRTIYASTPFDPRDRSPLKRHTLFKATTTDAGASWSWTPLLDAAADAQTEVEADDLRPLIARLDAQNALLLWLRGTYRTMCHYDLKAMAKPV